MEKLICSEKEAKKQLVACKKCGTHIDKMHAAPAFITVCRVCYVKENPHIDQF